MIHRESSKLLNQWKLVYGESMFTDRILGTYQTDCVFDRIKSVDMRYQVWKWGVIFTDNVSDEEKGLLK